MSRLGAALALAILTTSAAAHAQSAPPADFRQAVRELQESAEVVNSLGSSCTDLAELERRAEVARAPRVAERYRDEAAMRRRAAVESLRVRVVMALSGSEDWTPALFAEAEEPGAGPRADVETARAAVEQMRCYDATRAAQIAGNVDGIRAQIDAMIAIETKCRASAPCMATRAAATICALAAERREAAQEIQTERRNPGGVVDLVRLHNLGETVQALDGRIATAKVDYTKAARKPFTASMCTAASR